MTTNNIDNTYLSGIVREYLSWLQEVTGCPVEKEIADNVKKFSFNMNTYDVRKQLVKILNSFNTSHLAEAYIRCDRLCREWFSDNEIRIKNESDADVYIRIGEQYVTAGKYISEFNKFKSVYYPQLLESYRATGLLDDDNELNTDNAGDVACELETLEKNNILSDYLRIYTLHAGSEQIDFERHPFKVKDVIVCSDSLDQLLTAAKPTEDDVIHVSVTLKIEPIIDYSYFLIFVQYKDTVIVVTDQIEFSNPHVAVASRNPRRNSEKREDSTGLPYRMIDDIIKWREETTELSRNGQAKTEMYIKKLSEYLSGMGRLFLMKIISNMLKKISMNPGGFPLVGTFESMLSSQKLLGTSVDIETEEFNDSFGQYYNKKETREYYDSWIMPEESKTTLPAPVIRDLATVENYRGDVLVTADTARKMADYYVAKKTADAKSKIVWDYYETHADDEIYELEKLLSVRKESVLPYIFSGETVYIVDVQKTRARDFSREFNLVTRLSRVFHGTKDEKSDYNSAITFNELYPVECLESYKNWKGYIWIFNGRCSNSDAKAVAKGVRMWICHHNFISALLGVKRTDLPQVFQNYMSHHFVPYVGNSILEDINPMYLVEDPMSEKRPNGISVWYPFCGNCIRKYQKKYKKFENALIIYDSAENRILDVVDYDLHKDDYDKHKSDLDLLNEAKNYENESAGES